MKLSYQTPSLTGISDFQIIALAQSGVNEIPSNPANSCVDASCTAQSDGHDSFDLKVSWNDEAGTDVSLYTVNVHLEPANEDYALTDNTAGCDIQETGVGFYTLLCSDASLQGVDSDSCDCGNNDFEVVSISDGTNTLSVSSQDGLCVVNGTGNPCF
jgi:hypothetical protein